MPLLGLVQVPPVDLLTARRIQAWAVVQHVLPAVQFVRLVVGAGDGAGLVLCVRSFASRTVTLAAWQLGIER
jgi:hypothetical protein